MLLLQDAKEVVLELLALHIAGPWYGYAVAETCCSVLLDVVFYVVVVNVVYRVSGTDRGDEQMRLR